MASKAIAAARVKVRKSRRKRIADEIRWLVRRFLRALRHGDFDYALDAFEAQFKAIHEFDRVGRGKREKRK